MSQSASRRRTERLEADRSGPRAPQLSRLLSPDAISPRMQRLAVVALMLVFVVLRLWLLPGPGLDRTAWKEIDYITISQNYAEGGLNFFYPEVSWPAEEPRITPVEFPLVPYAAALVYSIFGFGLLTARFLTLLAFAVVTIYVFRLTKRELGPLVALVAAAASIPMALYHPFGRFLHTEPWLVAVSVAGLFHFAAWVESRRRRDLWLTVVALSLAFAFKLTALYLGLPLLWILWRAHGTRWREYISAIGVLAATLILPIAWYAWAYHLEVTELRHFSIFTGHDKMQTLTMITQSKWWTTMLGRVGVEILGGVIGVILLLAGLVTAIRHKIAGLFFGYVLAVGLFFIIVAEGNLDAPYRQITIIPAIAPFVGLGAVACGGLVIRMTRVTRANAVILGIGLLMIAGILVQSHVRESPLMLDANQPWQESKWNFAQRMRDLTPSDSLIVTAGEYTVHKGGNDLSPVLFYYSHRQGWILEPDDFDIANVLELVPRGATHLAVLPRAFEDGVEPMLADISNRYALVYEDGEYLLFDLQVAP